MEDSEAEGEKERKMKTVKGVRRSTKDERKGKTDVLGVIDKQVQ